MERLNIQELLKKSKGYEYAFFTTFSFDSAFFENNILSILQSNNIKNISLLVDYKEFYKKIDTYTNSLIWKNYTLQVINTEYSFHPKLILLLGKEKARVIISSANLTYNGYQINNEIFNYFDYDKNDNQYMSIIQQAFKYLYLIYKNKNLLDKDILNDIVNEYDYLKVEYLTQENVWFIDNYTNSIINKISKIMDIEKISQIDIAVPFYDSDLSAVKKIKDIFINSKVNLYIQNEFSTFNFNLNKEKKIIEDSSIKIYNSFNEIGTPSMYHGKVFRFLSNNDSYVLYGSSNCTNAALFNSSVDNGNYECNILVKGTLDEFDDYFNNFVITDIKEPCNRKLEYSANLSPDFSYIFNNDKDYIQFKYKDKINNLVIRYEEIELDYSYENNELLIEINDNLPFGIIALEFIYNDESHYYNGIIMNFEYINIYRNRENIVNEIPSNAFDNVKDAKYILGYKMLLDLIPYNAEEVENEHKDKANISDYENIFIEDEEIEEYEVIAGYDIPLENYKKKYENREKHINKIISNFYKTLNNRKNKSKGNHNGTSDDGKEKAKREPLTEEIKFKNIIKRKLKEANDKSYFNKLNYSNYINNIIILLNIIITYNADKEVELFKLSDYKEYIYIFLENICSKENIEFDYQQKEIIKFILFLYAVLTLSEIENKAKNEVNIKRFLIKYNKIFNLKDEYEYYLELSKVYIDREIDIEYIDRIIYNAIDNYTPEELINYLEKEIDLNASFENDCYSIVINTSEINNYFITNESVSNKINDIRNICKKNYQNTKVGSLLDIKIINEKDENIKSKRFLIDLRTGYVTRFFNDKEDGKIRMLN